MQLQGRVAIAVPGTDASSLLLIYFGPRHRNTGNGSMKRRGTDHVGAVHRVLVIHAVKQMGSTSHRRADDGRLEQRWTVLLGAVHLVCDPRTYKQREPPYICTPAVRSRQREGHHGKVSVR